MPITDRETGTRIDEVADSIYRISTPVPPSDMPGGFSFNQYLIVDEEPLLFHTGMRATFPQLREAIESVMPIGKLRWISFAHAEADETGAFRDLAGAAPEARPLCGTVQSMVAVSDLTERPPLVLGDGDSHTLGARSVTWIDAPHVPHGWDNGFLFESGTRTLFGGDLFTQPGADNPPVTEGDVLGPSEAFRAQMDYYAHAPQTRHTIDRLAALEPTTIACMHGSAYRGDGARLLRALGDALD